MPEIEEIEIHSDAMQDIISAVPNWMIRWGIMLILLVLMMILAIASFISYPDIVSTQLQVNALNSPKTIVAKTSGKIIRILVKNQTKVHENQALAFLESTAKHNDVLTLNATLQKLLEKTLANQTMYAHQLTTPLNLRLGEVQNAYQSFYQSYIDYKESVSGGFIEKKKQYLRGELQSVDKIKNQINRQRVTQEKEYQLAKEQYEVAKKLAAKGVLAKMELKTAEAKLLSQSYPLQQSQTELLNNENNYQNKQKEILELDNSLAQQKGKFIQALNTLLDASNQWIQSYVLRSPINGELQYAGIIQENKNVKAGDAVFIINPGNTDFYGEVKIPQYNLGKVHEGQRVLVKLQSYPFEEFGLVKGTLSYMTEAPINDSIFLAKVNFDRKTINSKIRLRNGMLANAEIITQESTLLQRFYKNMVKMMGQR